MAGKDIDDKLKEPYPDYQLDTKYPFVVHAEQNAIANRNSMVTILFFFSSFSPSLNHSRFRFKLLYCILCVSQ